MEKTGNSSGSLELVENPWADFHTCSKKMRFVPGAGREWMSFLSYDDELSFGCLKNKVSCRRAMMMRKRKEVASFFWQWL